MEFRLEWAMNFFSATGDEKGVHDGSSGNGADAVSKIMKTEAVHPNNAYEIFREVSRQFGQLTIQEDSKREDRAFTKRQHVFMIDYEDLNHANMNELRSEIVLRSQGPTADVIITNRDTQDFDAVMDKIQIVII